MQSVQEMEDSPALHSSLSVFTQEELDYCIGRVEPMSSITGIFCAKEAFLKAVSGLGDFPSFRFTDVSVLHRKNGRPYLSLYGGINDFLKSNSMLVDLSITHTAGFASAVVILST